MDKRTFDDVSSNVDDNRLGTDTLEREPIDVFDGRTLFSFRFNFSSSGQPSLLGSQAYLNCWASGIDDAGWELVHKAPIHRKALGIYSIDFGWPDLQVTKVEFDDDLTPNSKATASIQIYNSGSALRMHSM